MIWPWRVETKLVAVIWPWRVETKLVAVIWPWRVETKLVAVIWPWRVETKLVDIDLFVLTRSRFGEMFGELGEADRLMTLVPDWMQPLPFDCRLVSVVKEGEC